MEDIFHLIDSGLDSKVITESGICAAEKMWCNGAILAERKY